MLEKINHYFEKIQTCINNINRNEIVTFIEILKKARDEERQIFIFGNGGSATTASHFCCDMNKGLADGKTKRFKIIPLSDNATTIMAYANDMTYEDAFIEQLKNFLKKDDIVIALSGSGNSKNILKAVEYANEVGAITIGLTGYKNGKLKNITKYSVNANIDDIQVSEDMHLILTHLIYQTLLNEK